MGRLKDLSGQRFGKLLVVERAETVNGIVYWYCVCDCGGRTKVSSQKIRTGHTKSCGCLHGRGSGPIKADNSFRDDLTGKTFGRLRVIGFSHSYNGHTFFKTVCTCGNKKIISKQSLVRGTTVSCGCFSKDLLKSQTGKKNPFYKHGKTRNTPIWDKYHHIKGRCYRHNDKSFKSYGGRGIVMCRIWEKNPARFFSWAENNGFQEGKEIDRINNNGPYAPWNCQFISKEDNIKKRFEQANRYMPQ
jgi:hypothetical protein